MNRRRAGTLGVLVIGTLFASLTIGSTAAQAHPLGNFTINQYHGLALYPDHVVDNAVVDTAEIPTLQERGAIDTDGDGTVDPAEAATYAASECARLAGKLPATAGGAALQWRSGASSFAYLAGAQGLKTSRLTCTLSAPAALGHTADVAFATQYQPSRIGWREITAIGHGVRMTKASVPEQSISNELRQYPNDLLASPLNQRSATLTTTPGSGVSPGLAPRVSGPGFALRATQPISNAFNRLAGGKLTLGVGLAALGLSLLLGASHAVLPGHGKTVMAAYLVGRHGGVRDAMVVGATVTATHTSGVLAMGLLLSATAAVSGEGLLAWLGLASGAMIAGIGMMLLRSAWRDRRGDGHSDGHGHGHGHGHGRGHEYGRGHDHIEAQPEPVLVLSGAVASDEHAHPHPHPHVRGEVHGHDHRHAHDHPHPHEHGAPRAPFTRRGLIGLGVAGGLVPSPSALVVLLGSIALGRTWFGVGLVIGYGVGMAVTLMAAGLLLVRIRDRAATATLFRAAGPFKRFSAVMPTLTATLVVAVGVGLMLNQLPRI